MRGSLVEWDGGSITPMLGGMVFIVLTMVALATEVAGLHSAFLEVAAVADAAAEAGAALVDPASIHSGEVRLDQHRASLESARLVEAVAPAADYAVEVAALEVCVDVRVARPMGVLTVIGIDSFTVAASSCAGPATG